MVTDMEINNLPVRSSNKIKEVGFITQLILSSFFFIIQLVISDFGILPTGFLNL